jgi:OOP family OmpA-OmpF porin
MDQEHKANGAPSATAYAELRKLLLPEGEALSRLSSRLADPQLRAEDVSEVLPQAVSLRAARGPELRAAVRPVVEESIRTSILKDPSILADALFPVIGAAVRKAVAAALQSTIQTLNQIVEQSLSWRSLGWRWESITTGKSFGEIVLARSLLYRVEQVFLIHRETGLLLQQCSAESIVIRDADLVSGMLTAIQDFVRDSFGAQPTDQLETLRVGDFDVWIQYGPHAILAAVIRGTPPRQLKTVFETVLEHICFKKSSELENFHGDASAFLSCQEDLRACFVGQAPEGRHRLSPLWWLAAAILLEGIAYWIFTGVREHRRWDSYLARLHSQPGIVVTRVEKHGSSYTVSGLRDPLAVDPSTLISGTGVEPKNVAFHWEPYHSLQPSFESARRLSNERQIIEGQTLHFAPASSEISEEDVAAINQLAARLESLLATGKSLNRHIGIEVIGHTDGVGPDEQNAQIGQSRADAVRRALMDAGVPGNVLVARGVAATQPLRQGNTDTDKLFNRYVSFRVAIN